MQNKKFVTKFSVIYFIAYVVFAIAYTEFVPFLTKLGYSASERGILIASYAITNILFQIVFGFISDKYRNTKMMFIIALLGYVVGSFMFFNIHQQSFFLHLGFIALSGGLVNTCFGMLDNWMFTYGQHAREQFSFIRAFGSLGWAIVCFVLGYIINAFGFVSLGYICVVGAVVTFISMLLVNSEPTEIPTVHRQKIKMSDVKELINDPKWKLLTIILLFLYFATMSSSSVVMDKFIILGASSIEIGYRWMLCALVEIPLYVLGSKLLRRYGAYKLLMLAGFMIVLQFYLFAFSTSVLQMLIITCLQVFTAPIMMIASRMLYYDYSSEKLKTTSMLLSLSIYQGISMLLVPSLGGVITDAFGVNVTLICVASLALVGFVLTFKLDKLVKDK